MLIKTYEKLFFVHITNQKCRSWRGSWLLVLVPSNAGADCLIFVAVQRLFLTVICTGIEWFYMIVLKIPVPYAVWLISVCFQIIIKIPYCSLSVPRYCFCSFTESVISPALWRWSVVCPYVWFIDWYCWPVAACRTWYYLFGCDRFDLSVVDSKLFLMDPAPTFLRVSDPDFALVPDPEPESSTKKFCILADPDPQHWCNTDLILFAWFTDWLICQFVGGAYRRLIAVWLAAWFDPFCLIDWFAHL
jgi:hypothetical protein